MISNAGGSATKSGDDGILREMWSIGEVFLQSHDLLVDGEGGLSVVQFASNGTYPVKLERI